VLDFSTFEVDRFSLAALLGHPLAPGGASPSGHAIIRASAPEE